MPEYGQPQAPMGAPGPMPMMAPAMGALFNSIAGLAQNMPRTSMEKVREAMKLLGEARDEDGKVAGNLSMAMAIIQNGPEALEKFGLGKDR